MTNQTPVLPIKTNATGDKPWHVHENNLPDDQRLALILSVAELLERGERSTSAITTLVASHMPSGSCSRPTAIKYRNAAMQLIQAESKPMNRHNIRALEIGRYTFLIERIYKKIVEFEESKPSKTDETWLKWHDTYTKLLQRLDAFGARLHAITGLNEITINNGSDTKRIVFVRPGEKPKDDMTADPIGIAATEPPPAEPGA